MHSPADAQEDRTAELIPPVSPRAPWRVADVEALPGFRLRVRFNDGIEDTVEMAGFIASAEAGVFAVLRDEKCSGKPGLSWAPSPGPAIWTWHPTRCTDDQGARHMGPHMKSAEGKAPVLTWTLGHEVVTPPEDARSHESHL